MVTGASSSTELPSGSAKPPLHSPILTFRQLPSGEPRPAVNTILSVCKARIWRMSAKWENGRLLPCKVPISPTAPTFKEDTP